MIHEAVFFFIEGNDVVRLNYLVLVIELGNCDPGLNFISSLNTQVNTGGTRSENPGTFIPGSANSIKYLSLVTYNCEKDVKNPSNLAPVPRGCCVALLAEEGNN